MPGWPELLLLLAKPVREDLISLAGTGVQFARSSRLGKIEEANLQQRKNEEAAEAELLYLISAKCEITKIAKPVLNRIFRSNLKGLFVLEISRGFVK